MAGEKHLVLFPVKLLRQKMEERSRCGVMVVINHLAEMISEIAGKKLTIKHVFGSLGASGRNLDNKLIKEKLGWAPGYSLRKELERMYPWIEGEVQAVQ